MLSEDDSEPLAHAVAQSCAFVTFNVSDFISLHEAYITEGREHWGIIFSTEGLFRVLLRRLLQLLQVVTAHDLKNQIRWLNEFK
jgi:hypothetical protein